MMEYGIEFCIFNKLDKIIKVKLDNLFYMTSLNVGIFRQETLRISTFFVRKSSSSYYDKYKYTHKCANNSSYQQFYYFKTVKIIQPQGIMVI